MKGVRLVLFDLDGTLTTHKTGAWEAISEYAGECMHTHSHTANFRTGQTLLI